MSIKKEIGLYNYYEHFKYAKEIALVLPIDHPKRVAIERSLTEQLEAINKSNSDKNDAVSDTIAAK